MLATNFSNMKENFKGYCDKVINDCETVIVVTENDDENIVLMSLDQYNNMMENLEILKNPKYFIKLYKSIEQIKKGQTVSKTMEELEAMGDE